MKSTSNRLFAMRLTAGVMAVIFSLPAMAGPCSSFSSGLRQAQLQQITARQNIINQNVANVMNASQQLRGCWDQVVGIDMGSFGMPPSLAKIAINRLNQACEAAIQKATSTANTAINKATGGITSGMSSMFGGGSEVLGQLSQAWGTFTPEEKSFVLQNMDSVTPGSGAAFLQAQQASNTGSLGGFGGMTSGIPAGSGSFMPSGTGTVTQTGVKGALSQIGSFFSPSAN